MGAIIKPLGKPKRDLLIAIYTSPDSRGILAQLARKLKKSSPTIHQQLRELSKNYPPLVKQHPLQGWWELTDGGRGAVQALMSLEEPEATKEPVIQLWGKIAAGPAIPLSDESQEDLPIVDLDPDQHFALRVTGTSMTDYGILDGDIVVLRVADAWTMVRPGDIVAVRVPQGTSTISEEALNQAVTLSEDVNDPLLDHGTLKKMTGDNFLSLLQSIERGQTKLTVTGSQGQIIQSLAFQVLGVLVRVVRDYR